MSLQLVSIEVTNRCRKACDFCYNGSAPGRTEAWDPDDLVAFVVDLARHGVEAVSFGGGEPLEWSAMNDVLARLDGVLFRSLTTSGLPLLRPGALEGLVTAAPDKVHVSLHYPGRPREVTRVVRQVGALADAGLRSGVNLLVRASTVAPATRAWATLHQAGIGPERIVVLPMRGFDTPTPEQLGQVAGGPRFQSVSCLLGCGRSPRFCSVGADRSVAWCSYTRSRRVLADPTHAALASALDGLPLAFCGPTPEALPRPRADPFPSSDARRS
ncbi:MAG: radical SAM protein [Myxococcota bacterium]